MEDLTFKLWGDVRNEINGKYWFDNPEQIRAFVFLIEKDKKVPTRDIRTAYEIFTREIETAILLGLDSFWLEYVFQHRVDCLKVRTDKAESFLNGL